MIIIIGATGFIGMYTVDKFLEEGYEVLAKGFLPVAKKSYPFSRNLLIGRASCRERV